MCERLSNGNPQYLGMSRVAAQPGTRLCENLEFWHFCRRKLLFLLRAISEKLSFHTVWLCHGRTTATLMGRLRSHGEGRDAVL
jgi:hypothetical protein